MRSQTEIGNELNEKIYNVLRRGLVDRNELTVLMPISDYEELLLINDTITYKDVIMTGDSQEVIRFVGVKIKPVRDIDKIYVCL